MSVEDKWSRDKAAAYKKRLEINQTATAAGLEAIEDEANREQAEALSTNETSKLCPDEEERLKMALEANEHEERAETLRLAVRLFVRAYEDKAGKAPKTPGAKAAELEEFSKFLITKRKKLHLSQVRLAELSGVTFATVNRLENGHHGANAQTVRKISEALADEERRQEQRKKGNL